MDSGGWILIMMLGGTGIICFLAFYRKSPPSNNIKHAIYGNGMRVLVEEQQEDLRLSRRENQRLQDTIDELQSDIHALKNTNTVLLRTVAYWRSLYDQEKSQNK